MSDSLGSLYFGVIIFSLPALAALPYAHSFADEYQTGYLWQSMPRQGVIPYALHKFMSVTLAGALSVGLGMALFAVLVSILYLPSDPASNPALILPLEDTIWRNLYGVWGGLPFFIVQIILAMLFAMVWSGVGLLISAFIPNRYMAVAAPLVVYYALSSLCQLTGLHFLDPAEMLVQNDLIGYNLGFSYIIGCQISFILLLALAFIWRIRGRYRYA